MGSKRIQSSFLWPEDTSSRAKKRWHDVDVDEYGVVQQEAPATPKGSYSVEEQDVYIVLVCTETSDENTMDFL